MKTQVNFIHKLRHGVHKNGIPDEKRNTKDLMAWFDDLSSKDGSGIEIANNRALFARKKGQQSNQLGSMANPGRSNGREKESIVKPKSDVFKIDVGNDFFQENVPEEENDANLKISSSFYSKKRYSMADIQLNSSQQFSVQEQEVGLVDSKSNCFKKKMSNMENFTKGSSTNPSSYQKEQTGLKTPNYTKPAFVEFSEHEDDFSSEYTSVEKSVFEKYQKVERIVIKNGNKD